MGFFQDLKEDLSTAVDELDANDTVEEGYEVETEPVFNLDEAGMEELLNEVKTDSPMTSATSKEDILDETALITEGMVVTGDVTSKGSLDVIGEINGNISVSGKLNVTGTINGNSVAGEVYADAARINGEILSTGTIKVGTNSVIIGNITATCAVIAGAVKGDIDVQGPVILDASAIVMGNIKSKSVQINNGAVIEGLCSQCYADVSPTKFFSK